MTAATGVRSRSPIMRRIVHLLDWAFLFAAVGFFYFGLLDLVPTLVIIAAMPIAVLLGTLIHEIGHAVGAVVGGWRVIVLTVWPFAFHVRNRNFVMDPRVSTEDGGGYVLAAPASQGNNTRFGNAILTLGGPIFSLATATCFAVVALQPEIVFLDLRTKGTSVIHVDWLRMVGGLAAGFSIICLRGFVVTIVPMVYSSGKASDGLLLVRAMRRGTISVSYTGWIIALLQYNVRMRDIPAWMYEHARCEAPDSGYERSLHDAWDIARTLDEESVDASRARKLVEAYRRAYGDDDWLITCDAWLSAVHENNADHAVHRLESLKGHSNDPALLLAAQAAVAAHRGKRADVEQKLDAMDRLLKGATPFANPTFHDMRKRIEAIADASTAT